MKKIIALLLCALSIPSFATTDIITPFVSPSSAPTECAEAPPTTDPTFCTKFKSIAKCHCMADGGLPAGMCQDMNTIYNRMIAAFGTQDKACHWQAESGSEIREKDPSLCVADWDCYRKGTGACYKKCQ